MSSSELLSECRGENTDLVKQMVDDNADVNAAVDGVTPLMAAIEKDNRALVASLLDANASQRRISSSKCSALHYASQNGSLNVAEFLISRGCSVSIHDIVEAASGGYRAVVKVLINRYNQENGRSLLHLLPSLLKPDENPQHKRAMDVLLEECAAEINETSKDGLTPIERAVAAPNAYMISALVMAGVHFPEKLVSTSIVVLLLKNGYNDAARSLLPTDSPLWVSMRDSDTDGRSALHLAGTAEMVKWLLQRGCSVHVETKYQQTPLYHAKNADIATLLLDAGACISHSDICNCSPLLFTEHEDVATTLLQRNASIRGRGRSHETFLMMAVKWNNLPMVKQILESEDGRSMVNARDLCSCSALRHAVAGTDGSCVEIVKALIDAGVDVNLSGKAYQNPLHIAKNCDIIRLLCDSGADIDAYDDHQYTALHYRCIDGDTDAVKLLISLGASFKLRGDNQETALMLAASNGRLDIVNLLLSLYPKPHHAVNKLDSDGETALFKALHNSHSSVASVLIDAGSWVEYYTDDVLILPLVQCSDVHIAQKLLDNGADVNAIDAYTDRQTALDCASWEGDAKMVTFLLESKANVTPDEFGRTLLQTAYDRKNFDVIRAILSAEHSSMDWIESSNVEGRTLLSVAVGDDSRDVVASLIAAGAKQTADRDGKTPLHYVKSPAVARMLLEAGAPDVKDNSGYTPLMWLCRIGCDDDTLRLMLDPEYNLDVNAVHFGRTLLTISLINVNMSLFSILCAHPSVDVSMKDARYGETVLHLACSVTEAYVVKILLDAGADPHEEDRFGNTSLNGAYDDSEIVRLLVEAAPEVVYHRNRQNQNVLIYFCSRNCDINVLEDLFVCSDRCNVPIDVNVQDLNGDTALHVAMKHLNDETARLLLFKGADALMSGHEGMTVLMAPFLFDNIEKINDPPDDYNEDEHDGLSDDEGGYYTEEPKMSEEALDLRISHCIKTIVDSFFSRVHPAHQWIITRTGSGAGTKTGTVRHRKWYEPASKRRRK